MPRVDTAVQQVDAVAVMVVHLSVFRWLFWSRTLIWRTSFLFIFCCLSAFLQVLYAFLAFSPSHYLSLCMYQSVRVNYCLQHGDHHHRRRRVGKAGP